MYIWSGLTSIDILGTAGLLHSLADTTLKIHITDLSDLQLQSLKGHFFMLKFLSAINAENVEKVTETYLSVTKDGLKTWSSRWESVSKRPEVLRILDENQEINFVDESYFDQSVLRFCTVEFQSPARIIGQTMVEIDFKVRDSFLNWRLKELVRKGILTFEGELRDMRDYKIKLTSV